MILASAVRKKNRLNTKIHISMILVAPKQNDNCTDKKTVKFVSRFYLTFLFFRQRLNNDPENPMNWTQKYPTREIKLWYLSIYAHEWKQILQLLSILARLVKFRGKIAFWPKSAIICQQSLLRVKHVSKSWRAKSGKLGTRAHTERERRKVSNRESVIKIEIAK